MRNGVTRPPASEREHHKARMIRKQAVMENRIASADEDKGLLLVLTGLGKGKSSSAFGMVARALGHGMKVGVVQFIKAASSTGEEAFFRRFPDEVDFRVMGEGFTWVTQDRERDVQTAEAAWKVVQNMLQNPELGLLVLDELNNTLRHGYLSREQVLDDIRQRVPAQHVVVTGRHACQELIELADTVSEIDKVKHAFNQGIRAQRGIEF